MAAELIQFDIVSPERVLITSRAEMVTIPGSDGYMGIMAGHLPLITTLKPGMINVLKEGKDERYFIQGGFAEVSASKLVVLADDATPYSELSLDALDQQIHDAEEIVAGAQSESERTRAARQLDELRLVRAGL